MGKGKRSERREHERVRVPETWAVDCVGDDTFLYASISNVSEMGIFVHTLEPLPLGTRLELAFRPDVATPFRVRGEVAWVNVSRPDRVSPNPGMGVRFIDLSRADRGRLVDAIRNIAYVSAPN